MAWNFSWDPSWTSPVLQAAAILVGAGVSIWAVLLGAGLARRHEFRLRHKAALDPFMARLRDDVGCLRVLLDGKVESGSEWRVKEFKIYLQARHAVLPDKFAFQHAASVTGFDHEALLRCIVDAEFVMAIHAKFLQDLRVLIDAKEFDFDVSIKSSPHLAVHALTYPVITSPPQGLDQILEVRREGSKSVLGIPGYLALASGTQEAMERLRPKILDLIETAAQELQAHLGQHPRQPMPLLQTSVLHWRDELSKLHQEFESWLAFGIRKDRCDLCRRQL